MVLPEKEENEYALQFLLLDKDSDGFLDTKDVGAFLRACGMYPTSLEVQGIITLVDSGNTGKVSQEQMLTAVDNLRERRTSVEELREALKVLDDDADGYLTTGQLRHILVNLGMRLTHEEANEVIDDAECDEDGQINVDDLIAMLMNEKVL